MNGIRNFFTDEPALKLNDAILEMKELKDALYAHASRFRDSPRVHIYYATPGEWTSDQNISALFVDAVNQLRATNLFTEIHWRCFGSSELIRITKEVNLKIERIIEFKEHVILPAIIGVKEAFVGIIPCNELIKLISSDDGSILPMVFNDNVRDFQGLNSINLDIENTIKSPDMQSRFVLLNNGVTIVANSVKRVGSKFILRDFQVVNGCQTTSIIYLNRSLIGDSSCVPIKLIHTDDLEMTGEITKATNRQTPVTPEAFEALQPFHRSLEDYYKAKASSSDSLHYERRKNQYASSKVKPRSIVSLARQIQTFVAVVLCEPHSVNRYYGEILQSYRTRLFLEDHDPSAYYLAVSCVQAVDELIDPRSKDFDPALRNLRYHLAMLLRMMFGGDKVPSVSSKKYESYCSDILDKLNDANKARSALLNCAKVVTHTLEQMGIPLKSARAVARTRNFTETLIKNANLTGERVSNDSASAFGKQETGKFRRYWADRGYGFIARPGGLDIYVGDRQLRKVPLRKRYTGVIVAYSVGKNHQGLQAEDVELVSE